MGVRVRWRSALASALALASLATASRAEITPDARRVVERFLAATGRPVGTPREKSSHEIASISGFGFNGHNEAWALYPDQHASVTELGPFKLLEGYDGKIAWRTDPTTGKLVTLDGKDLEDARTGLWFDFQRWSDDGAPGGQVTVAAPQRDSGDTYTVLSATPQGGRARQLWFRDRDGLLVREISPRDNQTVVTELSEYHAVPPGGRLVPYHTSTTVEGMPMNVLKATLELVEFDVPISPSRFRRPDSSKVTSLEWLKTPGRAKFSFDYRARHVWLKASVDGGPPQDFIFDTGASLTVLDSAWAAKTGLKTQGSMAATGAGSAGSASFTKLDKLRIAGADGDGIEIRDVKVATLALNDQFAPYFWRDCAGVIGYDVISRFVVEIDYDARTLTLYDPATFHYDGKGTAIPVRLAGTVPVVKVRVDDRFEGDARIDVGSSSTIDFHGPFVKEHELDRRLRHGVTASGVGFGGTFDNTIGRLKQLAIGPYAWKDPVVSLSGASSGAFTSRDYAGNLGNRALERFKVTLDYERRQLWLEPGRHFGERDRFSKLGALLVRKDGHIEAASILPGSPADRAGFREGDVVVSIDGEDAMAADPEALEHKFEDSPNGRTCSFVLRRGGETVTLKAVLKEIL